MKYRKIAANLLCAFIPNREIRHKLRNLINPSADEKFQMLKYVKYGYDKTDESLTIINQRIEPDFDDVYILRVASGETYLILHAIFEIIKANGSKKPVIITTVPYHNDLCEIYCPNLPRYYIPEIWKIFLDKEYVRQQFGKRFFLLFPFEHIIRWEELLRQGKALHYYQNLLRPFNLSISDIPHRLGEIPLSAEQTALSKAASVGLDVSNFVFISPEARSNPTLSPNFWRQLNDGLREFGFDTYFNVHDFNLGITTKHCEFTVLECHALARHAKGVIGIKSGLIEPMIGQLGIPVISIFTSMYSRFYDVLKPMPVRDHIQGCTTTLLPGNTAQRFEFDGVHTGEDEILKEILSVFSKLSAKEKRKSKPNVPYYLSIIDEYLDSVRRQCVPGKFNLVCHKHLGDTYYSVASALWLEKKSNNKFHFHIQKNHEFIMKMLGVTNYSVIEPDKYIANNAKFLTSYTSEFSNVRPDPDSVNVDVHNRLFPSFPVHGEPFIAESDQARFINFSRFWCYRWSANLGCEQAEKFHLPAKTICILDDARRRLSEIAPLNKIVLFAPDSLTSIELPIEFWNTIAEIVHQHGYTILVNSSRYKINHGIPVDSLNLNLSDVVALGLSCAYVFTLRSGICDVLVGAKERLYVFYTAMIHREMRSLNACFDPIPNTNEIAIWRWRIDNFLWEGEDLSQSLQPIVDSLRKEYFTHRFKALVHCLSKKNKHRHKLWYRVFRNLAGNPKQFPENNVENVHHKYAWNQKISILGVPLYTRKFSGGSKKWSVRHSILGGLLRYKRSDDYYRISLLGIQLLTHSVDANKILYIRFPRRRANQRWLNRLQSQIPPHHDDIYILRHNIGESYVELLHLDQTIKVNQSKRPLLIAWDRKNVSFYQLFRHQNLEMRYVSLKQSDIHRVFNDKTMIQQGHQRFFCSTPWVAENMLKQYNDDRNVNFYSYIKSQSGVWNDGVPLLPEPSADVKALVEKKIQRYNLGDKFIILAPEVNSLVEMSQSFWSKLACCLHAKGYRLFLNTWKKERMHVPHTVAAELSIAEVFALAQKSSGIISMASGLSVLLTAAGSKMDLLYTKFSRESTGYDSALAKKIYSVSHLPGIAAGQIQEHDTNQLQEQELLNLILDRY